MILGVRGRFGVCGSVVHCREEGKRDPQMTQIHTDIWTAR